MAARRECVRQLQLKGLSERQACRLVDISTSVLRYRPRDDSNQPLRERLKELAGQHRRHGYRMLHNRLRNDGWIINVKRTYRLYRQEGLMVRKCQRYSNNPQPWQSNIPHPSTPRSERWNRKID